jgi:hypothetical protein
MDHTDMASQKKKFNSQLKRSEDLITPKTNITILITYFVYLELEVTNPSPKKRCKQT